MQNLIHLLSSHAFTQFNSQMHCFLRKQCSFKWMILYYEAQVHMYVTNNVSFKFYMECMRLFLSNTSISLINIGMDLIKYFLNNAKHV